MPLIHAKLIEETFTPTQKKIEEENMPPATLADVEDILGDEWDFGLSAMTVDAIRTLIAGE